MALKGQILLLFALAASMLLLFGCIDGAETSQPNGQENAAEGLPQPSVKPDAEPAAPLVNVSAFPSANANQRLIKEVVGSFEDGNEETLNNVSKISALGPDAIDDILPLLKQDNSYAQWAGLEALGPIITQADAGQQEKIKQALLPLLESRKPSIRAYAAYALLYLGEKKALPVMVELLGNTDRLLASEPPAQICNVANSALVRHTNEDFGFGCRQGWLDAGAKAKWDKWREEKGGELEFDATSRKFVGG